MFRCLKVYVKIGLEICNFAELLEVHESYCMQSHNFWEFWESGFLELAFLNRFTGNIDIYIYIERGIDAFSNNSVRTIDAEPKMTEG